MGIIHRVYEASGGVEEFISAEDKNQTLIGFIRLRIPGEKPHRPEITVKTGLIRELHVYGEMTPVGEAAQDWQHQGWGEQLMHEAEKTAHEQYDMNKMIVMSALGTKQYYGRFGYEKEGFYVARTLL
jgi:elongator complex protein 3